MVGLEGTALSIFFFPKYVQHIAQFHFRVIEYPARDVGCRVAVGGVIPILLSKCTVLLMFVLHSNAVPLRVYPAADGWLVPSACLVKDRGHSFQACVPLFIGMQNKMS